MNCTAALNICTIKADTHALLTLGFCDTVSFIKWGIFSQVVYEDKVEFYTEPPHTKL